MDSLARAFIFGQADAFVPRLRGKAKAGGDDVGGLPGLIGRVPLKKGRETTLRDLSALINPALPHFRLWSKP